YATHVVVGIDIDPKRVAIARQKHPGATFYTMSAHDMRQFREAEFDSVVSNVAVPYMDIPVALAEISRVLKPGGTLHITLHNPSFTWGELRRCFPRPKPSLFRLFVLANGVWFHLTGKVLHVGSKCESFQTVRGITKALSAAGFTSCDLPAAKQFVVTATKPSSVAAEAFSYATSGK